MDQLDLLDQILQTNKETIEQKELKDKKKKQKQEEQDKQKYEEKQLKKRNHPKYCVREDGNKKWVDLTLKEWDPNDYRIFVGNLGDEITDDHLIIVFQKYPSFKRAKVIKEKVSAKNKGYGFVSFGDSKDYIRAMKEVQGKYIGKKPVVLKRSDWQKKGLKKIKKKKISYLNNQIQVVQQSIKFLISFLYNKYINITKLK